MYNTLIYPTTDIPIDITDIPLDIPLELVVAMNEPSKLTQMNEPSKLTQMNEPSKLTQMNEPSKLTQIGACRSYERALQIDPNDPNNHSNLAVLLHEQFKDYKGARRDMSVPFILTQNDCVA